MCYSSFEGKPEKAIKAAVMESQWGQKTSSPSSQISVLNARKKIFNTGFGNDALNLHHAQTTGRFDWVRTAEQPPARGVFLSPVPSCLGLTVQQQKQHLRQ